MKRKKILSIKAAIGMMAGFLLYSCERHKGTDFLYRVTFHELGHSMHARLGGSIVFTSKIIRESWADFIEHYFTMAYYPTQSNNTSKLREDRSDWTDGYTPLFIDLE